MCYEIILPVGVGRYWQQRQEARGTATCARERRVEVAQGCGNTREVSLDSPKNPFLAEVLVKRIGLWGHRIPRLKPSGKESLYKSR